MMRVDVRWIWVLLLSLAIWGCAAPQPQVQPEAAPEVSKPAPPPAPETPPVLDVRLERRLTKDLLQSVEQYFRLLKERNAEQAARYVEAERREAFQNDLWDLLARFDIQSADVASYQLFPQPDDTVTASVKVIRTMFPRNSVVPTKSELWMSWEYRDNRWILRPQKDK